MPACLVRHRCGTLNGYASPRRAMRVDFISVRIDQTPPDDVLLRAAAVSTQLPVQLHFQPECVVLIQPHDTAFLSRLRPVALRRLIAQPIAVCAESAADSHPNSLIFVPKQADRQRTAPRSKGYPRDRLPQSSPLHSDESRNQAAAVFSDLLQQLGQASPTESESALARREMVEPEPELSPQMIARLQQLLAGE